MVNNFFGNLGERGPRLEVLESNTSRNPVCRAEEGVKKVPIH